jgi:hypothetical protein
VVLDAVATVFVDMGWQAEIDAAGNLALAVH